MSGATTSRLGSTTCWLLSAPHTKCLDEHLTRRPEQVEQVLCAARLRSPAARAVGRLHDANGDLHNAYLAAQHAVHEWFDDVYFRLSEVRLARVFLFVK